MSKTKEQLLDLDEIILETNEPYKRNRKTPLDKTKIKKNISTILLGAVNGAGQKYRTITGHIQWGLVEQDIHNVIDEA